MPRKPAKPTQETQEIETSQTETQETQERTYKEEMLVKVLTTFTQNKILLYTFKNVTRFNGEIIKESDLLAKISEQNGETYTVTSSIEKVEVRQIEESDLSYFISEETRQTRIDVLVSEIETLKASQIELEKEKDFKKNEIFISNSDKLKDLNALLNEVKESQFYCFSYGKEKQVKGIAAAKTLLINNIDFNDFFKPESWRKIVKANKEKFVSFSSPRFFSEKEEKFNSLSTKPLYEALQKSEVRKAFQECGTPKITSLKFENEETLTFD